jgi:hypothetical protein
MPKFLDMKGLEKILEGVKAQFVTKDALNENVNYIKNVCLGGKIFKFLTQAEYDKLSDADKYNENIVYNIIDSENNMTLEDLEKVVIRLDEIEKLINDKLK